MHAEKLSQRMYEQSRTIVLRKLEEWYNNLDEEKKDLPLASAASGGGGANESVTPRSMLSDVKKGTAEGERIVQDWLELAFENAIEHILQAEAK